MIISKSKKTLVPLFCVLFSFGNFINTARGLKCYKCDSTKDENCLYDLTKINLTECAEGEVSCVTRIDSKGMVIRECLDKSSWCFDPICRECKEDGCNSNLVCHKCDSSTNSDCAQLTSSRFLPELCSSKTDKCLTIVKEDKNIERKCTSTKCDESKAKTCQTCEKSYCNIEVFPKERQLCYQCTKDNADCNELKAIKPIPCRLYDENDKCYTIGTSATDMNRGCMSDINNKCSGNTCATCDDQNCNKLPFIRNPSLKCFQCASTDKKCSEEPSLCQNKLEYWKETEECYTKTTEGQSSRGCVNDLGVNEEPCNKADFCFICKTEGCNSFDDGEGSSGGSDVSGEGSGGNGCNGNSSFTCIKCHSDRQGQETCKDDAHDIAGSSCVNCVTENGICFTERFRNGTVIRGCLADYDKKRAENCLKSGYKACEVCQSENCNNKKAPQNDISSLPVILNICIACNYRTSFQFVLNKK